MTPPTPTEASAVFYNLRLGRPHTTVRAELRAILHPTTPRLIAGFSEANRYPFPQIPGYTLIRDRSTASRGNIAAYINTTYYQGHRWIDLHHTWDRTQHPGRHEPRSFPIIRAGGAQLTIAHQPPAGHDTRPAQMESIDALTRTIAPWTRPHFTGNHHTARQRPRLLLWDANLRPGEDGPGPDMLAARTGATLLPLNGIDGGLFRGQGVAVLSAEYARKAGPDDLLLGSDHRRGMVEARLILPLSVVRPGR